MMIAINNDKATCRRCGKQVNWSDINVPHIVTKPCLLCDECLDAVIKFIEERDDEIKRNF